MDKEGKTIFQDCKNQAWLAVKNQTMFFFCTALWHNSWVSQDVVVNGTHLYIHIWGFGEDLSTEGSAALPSFQSLKTDDINVPPCLDRITLGFRINFVVRLLK